MSVDERVIQIESSIQRALDLGDIVGQCCDCRIMFKPGGTEDWIETTIVPPDYKNISHGYCPPCHKAVIAQVREYNNKQ